MENARMPNKITKKMKKDKKNLHISQKNCTFAH